jgi:hypothetical protein
MKYLFLIFVLAACSSKPKAPPKETRTIVAYPFSVDQNEFRTGIAFKVTIDSIGLDSAGKVSRRDFTFYRVAVNVVQQDSLGHLKKDSSGRQMIDIKWVDMAEKAILTDYNKDWKEYLPDSTRRAVK